TGPGGSVVPVLLCAFQQANPALSVSLAIHDTQRVIELVADRELELGIVGPQRRHRGVAFEPLFSHEVILVTPPDHRFAGRTLAAARVEGLEPRRQIVVARAAGRAPTRAAEAFLAFARERLA